MLLGWGALLALHAWNVYGHPRRQITEADIARETERLRGPDVCLGESDERLGQPDERLGQPDERLGESGERLGQPDGRSGSGDQKAA